MHRVPRHESKCAAWHGHRYVADLGMRTALNDCLYRNMYRYERILVADLDEVIVPSEHVTYRDIVQQRKQELKTRGAGKRGTETYGCDYDVTKTRRSVDHDVTKTHRSEKSERLRALVHR